MITPTLRSLRGTRRVRPARSPFCSLLSPLSLSLAAALLLAPSGPAQAAIQYFDANGTTAGSGNTGTGFGWGTGFGRWNFSADGTGPQPVWVNGNDAVFSAGTDRIGSFTMTPQSGGGAPTVHHITVEEGSPTVSTNTLTLVTSQSTIDVAGGSTLTIDSTLAGSVGWKKTGTGTLVLGGSNGSFTGGKSVSVGTVKLTSLTGMGSTDFGFGVAGVGTLELAVGGTYDFLLSGGLFGTLRSTVSSATVDSVHDVFKVGGGTINVVTIGHDLLLRDPITDTGAGFTKAGAGRVLLLSNTSTITGPITVSGGILQIGGAGATNINGTNYAGAIANSGVLSFQTTTSQTLSGIVSGTGSLTKGQASTLTLSGANTYSGNTLVSGGTLALSHASNNNIASSAAIIVNSGATLDVTGLASGRLDVASGQTLSGKGTVVGDIALLSGATVAPGTSPGTLFADNFNWQSGGIYEWEVIAETGTPGTQWDLLDLTGGTLSFTGGGPFFVDIDTTGATGFAPGAGPFSFQIATADSITGFNASNFTLTANGPPASYVWSIFEQDNSIFLQATPTVPEPSTFVLAALGLFGLGFTRRRNHHRS